MTERKNRQSTIRQRIANTLCRPSFLTCLYALLLGVCLKLTSENLREQIEILAEKTRSQAFQIGKLKADSRVERAHFNAELREYQTKVEYMISAKQILREQIVVLTEQNSHQASQIRKLKTYAKEQRANFYAQLQECKIKENSANSEKQTLRENIVVLTEHNSHQASHIEKLETNSKEQRANCEAQLREYKIKDNSANSEKQTLRENIAVLTDRNSHQASHIEKLENNSKEQRENCEEQLREYKIKVDAITSENHILLEQIAFANRRLETMQSEMNKNNDVKENNIKARAIRLQESEFHKEGATYLIRCLRDSDSTSDIFVGIKLFWGALELGSTSKSSLDNCLKMYSAIFKKQPSFQSAP